MDDVERVVIERQDEQVGHLERDAGDTVARGRLPGLLDHPGGGVDPHHPARGHGPGHIAGDGARPATDIEQVDAGNEVRHQVGGRVGHGAPAVRAQDTVVVAVCV